MEREIPLIQRGIVDNCFEEGHYEYGIGVLDRLRTNRYKPFPLHIRQLVFIALYSPSPEPDAGVNRVDAPRLSPQKTQLLRQKDDLWPKPTSRPPAIALLNAFVNTNTPESLMRGLPYHTYVNNQGVMDVDPFQGDKATEVDYEDNSPLKDGVLAMQGQRDCWELLRDGLVKRKQADRHRNEDDSDLFANDVVGPYAWPVLEWLIHVFEKDERRAKDTGQAPHSALLLCQIPAPKSKRGPRWDVEMPLKVAFACFIPQASARSEKFASSEKRSDLGARLITLLVNLTLTKAPFLSPSHFLRTLVQHLPALPEPSFETFLASIPSSQALFKIALLESYILQENGLRPEIGSPLSVKTSTAGLRAKPKFTGKGAAMSDAASTVASTSSQEKDRDPYPIPTPTSLLKHLAFPPSPLVLDKTVSTFPMSLDPAISSLAKIALAKSHVVLVLWMLRVSHRLGDMDTEWRSAVREGRLRKSLQDGFTIRGASGGEIHEDSEVKEYLARTLEVVGLWEACVIEFR